MVARGDWNKQRTWTEFPDHPCDSRQIWAPVLHLLAGRLALGRPPVLILGRYRLLATWSGPGGGSPEQMYIPASFPNPLQQLQP